MPSSSWHVGAVRAREAMLKVQEAMGPGADWDGVLIAHCDTGYTNHAVFNLGTPRPSLLTGHGANFMEPTVATALDPLNYGSGIGEAPGHGTRTGGTLCGNLAGSYVGLAPSVPVVPYRVTNSVALSGRTILNLAAAIDHAIERNAADVISISLGVQSVFGNVKQMAVLGRAVDRAYSAGVIVVGAGGQTKDAPELVAFNVYPGRYSRAIGVGGINSDMEMCFDYEVGRDSIDVWAPADDIRRPNSVLGQPEPFLDVAGQGDGTSYATVHVSAAAAMWLRVHGMELAQGGYRGWKRVEAFRSLLRSTSRKLAGNDVRNKPPPQGTGIVDCLALVEAALPPLSSLKERKALAENEHN
jgi:subtilisin family serine protease